MKILVQRVALVACCCLALGGVAAAAEPANDAAALAKVAQNPLATMVTLPLQANYNGGVGPYDRTMFNLNVQPVIPFPGENWNVITRTIIPINSVPVGMTDSEFGLGDTNFSIFWSPAKDDKLIWGVGAAALLPTASNPEVLGSEKWSVGPTAVVFYSPVKQWTMGFLANNIWSIAGKSNRQDVDQLTLQWFINYNLGKGLAIGTSPIVTCNWEITTGDKCTIPWGLNVSKVMRFGAQPVNLLAGYYTNSTHPDGGAEDQVRLQINFMFPKK